MQVKLIHKLKTFNFFLLALLVSQAIPSAASSQSAFIFDNEEPTSKAPTETNQSLSKILTSNAPSKIDAKTNALEDTKNFTLGCNVGIYSWFDFPDGIQSVRHASSNEYVYFTIDLDNGIYQQFKDNDTVHREHSHRIASWSQDEIVLWKILGKGHSSFDRKAGTFSGKSMEKIFYTRDGRKQMKMEVIEFGGKCEKSTFIPIDDNVRDF